MTEPYYDHGLPRVFHGGDCAVCGRTLVMPAEPDAKAKVGVITLEYDGKLVARLNKLCGRCVVDIQDGLRRVISSLRP